MKLRMIWTIQKLELFRQESQIDGGPVRDHLDPVSPAKSEALECFPKSRGWEVAVTGGQPGVTEDRGRGVTQVTSGPRGRQQEVSQAEEQEEEAVPGLRLHHGAQLADVLQCGQHRVTRGLQVAGIWRQGVDVGEKPVDVSEHLPDHVVGVSHDDVGNVMAGVGQKDTDPVAVEVNNLNEAGLISVKEAVLEDLEYPVKLRLRLYFPR